MDSAGPLSSGNSGWRKKDGGGAVGERSTVAKPSGSARRQTISTAVIPEVGSGAVTSAPFSIKASNTFRASGENQPLASRL